MTDDKKLAVESLAAKLATEMNYHVNQMVFGTDIFPNTDDIDQMRQANKVVADFDFTTYYTEIDDDG